MKKLFSLLGMITIGAGAIVPTSILAEVAFNQQVGQFYSKNAPQDVDQNEYHILFRRVADEFAQPKGIINLSARDWAAIFGFLRVEGTPAALRLIHDLELLIKDIKDDINRLNKII